MGPAEQRGPPQNIEDLEVYDLDPTSTLTGEVNLNDDKYLKAFKSCVQDISAYEAQHGGGVFDAMSPENYVRLREIFAKSVCTSGIPALPCSPTIPVPPSSLLPCS